MTKKIYKNQVQDKQDKLKTKKNNFNSNLTKRLISTMVLLVLLVIYLMFSILYTEGLRNNWNYNPNIFGYIFFVVSTILVGIMTYEIAISTKIQELWLISLLIILAMGLFVFPASANINNIIDIDMGLKQDGSWYRWWYSLIFSLGVIASFWLIGFYKTKSESPIIQGMVLASTLTIVAFGMKGFVVSSTSMLFLQDGSNLISSSWIPRYSFTTPIWIWMTIILTDSFAYLGGSKFGKNQLAPKISPNKTIEGAFIGVLVAMIIGSLFSTLTFYLSSNNEYGPFSTVFNSLANNSGQAVPGVLLVLLTLMFSLISIFGDLFFSAMKRIINVKDFSKVIPGHGGVMDRLDSFVFVFFFVFVLTLVMR